MIAVTTFSKKGWISYGHRFVTSFLQHWPIRLVVYAESQNQPIQHQNLVWLNLDDDRDRKKFIDRYSAPQFNHQTDFNMMAVKFSHKIWAVTARDVQSNYRIWIDADVDCIAPISIEQLASIVSAPVCYLGRQGFMRPGQPLYPETGFVSYETRLPAVRQLLDRMRSVYTTGELFTLGQHNWHDAYTFDFCRRQFHMEQKNLSPDSKGLDAFEFSPLHPFLRHNKGPRRKARAYGGVE